MDNQSKVEAKEAGTDDEKSPEPKKYFDHNKWLQSETSALDRTEVVQLTKVHQELIRNSWSIISPHMAKNGTRVFIRIFEVSSGIKSVFKLGDVDYFALNKHPTVVRHSTQFMEAIEFTVGNLDQLQTLVAPVFINLGKHHIHFRGLKDDYFAVFSGALMFVWRETLAENFTADTRSAWSRLIDFLIQHLQFGYHLALQEQSE